VVLSKQAFAALFAFTICFSTIPTFAANQDLLIPKWVLTTYQYFKNEQTSEQEFENALSYLQKVGIIRLLDDFDNNITNFLMTYSLIKQNAERRSEFSDCSPNWYITGYFTPVESDYASRFIDVNIDKISYKFRESFVDEIKTEGWGKTLSGKYLGWFDDSFHISEFPLDAAGNNLELHTVAIDPSVISPNSRIMIPTLPPPWDKVVFLASDVGTAIIGKHIDVYAGEGKDAREETFRITGQGNIVCLEVK
jgi:3D (Asp-Asp-Asp) domain-containing protein